MPVSDTAWGSGNESGVGLGVDVGVRVANGPGVSVGMAVKVVVGNGVGKRVGVGDNTGVGVAVGLGGVGDNVGVGTGIGVRFGVDVAVKAAVGVRVGEGMEVGDGVEGKVAVALGSVALPLLVLPSSAELPTSNQVSRLIPPVERSSDLGSVWIGAATTELLEGRRVRQRNRVRVSLINLSMVNLQIRGQRNASIRASKSTALAGVVVRECRLLCRASVKATLPIKAILAQSGQFVNPHSSPPNAPPPA